MIDQLKQYKAFGKFVEWMKEHGYYFHKIHQKFFEARSDYDFTQPSNRELLSLLIEFCDSEKHMITIRVYYENDNFTGFYFDIDKVFTTEYTVHSTHGFTTRAEATQAGVKKIFELMEAE